MHGEPRRLVHHSKVGVAVQDLQRAFLGLHDVGGGRKAQFHTLTGAHLLVGVHAYLPVHGTAPLLHQLLETTARLVAHRAQEGVEARLLSGGDFEDQRRVFCGTGRAFFPADLLVVQSFKKFEFLPLLFLHGIKHVLPPFPVRGTGPEARQGSPSW